MMKWKPVFLKPRPVQIDTLKEAFTVEVLTPRNTAEYIDLINSAHTQNTSMSGDETSPQNYMWDSSIKKAFEDSKQHIFFGVRDTNKRLIAARHVRLYFDNNELWARNEFTVVSPTARRQGVRTELSQKTNAYLKSTGVIGTTFQIHNSNTLQSDNIRNRLKPYIDDVTTSEWRAEGHMTTWYKKRFE